MSNTIYPDLAAGAIAASSGTEVVTTALGVAAVLGNIAGPYAEIVGPMGERIHPGFNLVVAGGNCPRWYQAQKLLLDPVEACQREFRERAAAVTRERLDHMQAMRPHVDKTNELVTSHDGELPRHHGPDPIAAWNRPFIPLRRPTFALRSPTADIFEVVAPEILDGEVFAYFPDGGFAPTGRLASAIHGADQMQACEGLGSVGAMRAFVLATLTKNDLGLALSADPLRVLEQCLLAPQPQPGALEWPLETVQDGYLAFNRAVRRIASCRRKGAGPCVQLNAQEHAALVAFSRELQRYLERQPEDLGRYFRHYPALPYKLMWAFFLLSDSRDKCVPFIEYVVTETVTRQRDLLLAAQQAAEEAGVMRIRLVMLRKIAERPGRRRDLFRSYPVQRKELHAPVLLQLIAEGLVAEQDGLLKISDAGEALLT